MAKRTLNGLQRTCRNDLFSFISLPRYHSRDPCQVAHWNDALRKYRKDPFSLVLSRIIASVLQCEKKMFCVMQ